MFGVKTTLILDKLDNKAEPIVDLEIKIKPLLDTASVQRLASESRISTGTSDRHLPASDGCERHICVGAMTSRQLTAGILIVSETAAQNPQSDSSGELLRSVVDTDGGDQWDLMNLRTQIVPDNVIDIQRTVLRWADGEGPLNLIVTTGVALMSRPVAGVRNKSIIITLPGSPKGAKENLQSVIKLLPHACVQAAGADSRSIHAGGVDKLEKEAGLKQGARPAVEPTRDHHHYHHHHSHAHGHSHGGHAVPIPHVNPEYHPLSNDPEAGPTRRNRSSPYPMLTVDEALKLIINKTPAPKVIEASVSSALVGAVLAEDVIASEAVPAFRASIVDGYAVAVPKDGSMKKGIFPVASVSLAQPGEVPALKDLQIARITTGAPLPLGATSVVMVEDTILKSKTDDGKEEKEVEILTDHIKHGENVREIGSDIQTGATILRRGEEITSVGGELGLLASVGIAKVSVYKRPIVGVLSTGDEIVPHNRHGALRLGEVRDCNRPTILATINGWGFESIDLGIASDKPGALEEVIRRAFREVDVVITTGGVSMGELDLLKPTIERSLGGTIHFGRVAMKPGKPTTFATVPVKNDAGEREPKLIFSLPGNPASAIVTLHLFVLPSLHQAAGIYPTGLPKVVVTLDQDIMPDRVRTEYHRSMITARRDGLLYAISTGGQRSSRIGSLKSANALLCLQADDKVLKKGQKIEALLMGRVLSDSEKWWDLIK
ncbi:MAG: hypothetical protein M1836_006272 [Candelina mexicana]|nr:MAG: hypothetical protein M1836_006272 [Candelina mexicana]